MSFELADTDWANELSDDYHAAGVRIATLIDILKHARCFASAGLAGVDNQAPFF
jgi:hypothetical protein